MKKLIISSLFLACVITACNSEKKKTTVEPAKSDSISTEGMDPQWVAYMKPGGPHQMLAKDNGRWDAEISFYYNPDSPSVHKAVCDNKMILGGRYQQSSYTGSINKMPFEGIATMAFDNSRKIYISTWIDNMGTGVMYLEGTYDEPSKTMTLMGRAVDVTTGKDIQTRETMKFVDDNTRQMEMFETREGKETKTMAIILTRGK